MHHFTELLTSPIFWVILVIFLNYHHLPKWVYSWMKYPFIWFAWLVNKLDQYLFDDPDEVKEIKKSRFKKIVSPFGNAILAFIAILVYGGDYLFIKPASKIVNRIIESDRMKKVITFVENRNIIWLRIFVGIPFFAMEITGIFAGVMFFSNPILGAIIYLSKFAWVIPFKFIDKVGHDKLSNDPWYSGLKSAAVKAIDWLFALRFMKKIHNLFVKIKNFFKDSEHSTALEIKLRKKVIAKALKEVVSLKHLSTELSDSSDIELIFFSPDATKKLKLLQENPDNQLIREDIVDYILKELKSKEKTEEKEDVV